MSTTSLRPLTRAELGTAVDWAAAEGWNPGLHDADAFWATDPAGFWAIELDGALVGSGSTVCYGTTYCFAGFFIVLAEHRGAGVGAAAAPALIDHARSRLGAGGAVAIDGVFAMVPYYETLGFVLGHRNLRMEGVGRADPGAAEGLVPLADVPFDDLVAFDADRFGAERPAFLRRWVSPEGGLGLAALGPGDRIEGAGVVRPCRRGFKVGPLFATSPPTARRLMAALAHHAAGAPLVLDVPERTRDAMGLADEFGMTEVFGCARMVIGPPPPIRWDDVYGVTTFELG